MIFTFLKDIKPEAGTIGTKTEEKDLYEAWNKELDQEASDGEEGDAAAAGVAPAADTTPTSPGSVAGLTSAGEDRLVAYTEKVQGKSTWSMTAKARRGATSSRWMGSTTQPMSTSANSGSL